MGTTGDDPYRIAALQQKGIAQYDLMRPGNGTPWEDRGSSGTIGAFVRTVFRSLFTPSHLFDSLRRPETTSDAAAFAWLCGIMWSLGIIANDIITYLHESPLADNPPPDHTIDFNVQIFFLETVLRAAAMPFILFFFLKLSASMFKAISAGELKGAPRTLVQNVFAYSLGPSVLAIIPPWYLGMPIAALWILVNMIVAARKRLYMSSSGAIVACVLTWISGVAIAAAGCAVVWFFWTHVIQYQSFNDEYIPPHPHGGG
jgi:hypothetical protein